MHLELIHQAGGRSGKSRTPVLFVHGAYCGAWIWTDRYMPYFSDNGLPAYALSLRGHGYSEGNVHWAAFSDYVDDLEAIVRQIGVPPILIGHSMGGLVVQHYLSRGNKAPAAVLMASVPPSGLAASAMHMSFFAPEVLWQISLLQSLGPAAIQPDIIHRAFFSAETPVSEVLPLLRRLRPESHRATAELMSPGQPIPPRGPDRLPFLVIGGDADLFIPQVSLRETATYFGADIDILKGAPHGLMLDHGWWQPSADSIIAWLDAQKL